MNKVTVLAVLFPSASPMFDFNVLSTDGVQEIKNVTLKDQDGNFLTDAQLEEMVAAATPSIQTALASKATLRTGLLTAWEQTFTVGERAFLKPVFTEALAAFDRGDLAGCKEIVATAPSISADLNAKKVFIVGLFP
jgi:hypothetical protein